MMASPESRNISAGTTLSWEDDKLTMSPGTSCVESHVVPNIFQDEMSTKKANMGPTGFVPKDNH